MSTYEKYENVQWGDLRSNRHSLKFQCQSQRISITFIVYILRKKNFFSWNQNITYIFFQIGHRRLNWIQDRQRFSRTMHKSSWTYLYQRSWSSIWGRRSHLCPRIHPRQWQFNSQRHPSFGHVSCLQIMYKNGNNNFMSDYFSWNHSIWRYGK